MRTLLLFSVLAGCGADAVRGPEPVSSDPVPAATTDAGASAPDDALPRPDATRPQDARAAADTSSRDATPAPSDGPPPAFKPMLSVVGKLLLQDDFASRSAGAFTPIPNVSWSGNGTWVWEAGALKGSNDDGGHCAGITRVYRYIRNAVVQVSFKYQGGAMAVGFQKGNPIEHVFKATISPSVMRLYKSGGFGPTSTEELLREVPVKLAQGVWYTLLLEVVGNRVMAQLNTGAVAAGEAAGIDVDKYEVNLQVCGMTVWFDDFRLWEALPRAGA